MKAYVVFVFLFFWGLESSAQPDSLLKKEIDSLFAADQQIQTDMIAAYQNNAGQKIIDSLNRLKEELYKRHIPLLRNMIRNNGLPGYRQVGKESSDKFMTMVNHSFSDIAFQQKVAGLGKKQVKDKNISAPDLAMMIDKMRIKSGKKQIYGTQCSYTSSGEAVAVELQRPLTVNRRRKKMGLSSLDGYLKMMTELHKEMNRQK